MGGKGKPMGKKYAKQNGLMDILFPTAAPKKERKSKSQDSNKVHNTKGRNTHGRTHF
jgi:hypothetical protein